MYTKKGEKVWLRITYTHLEKLFSRDRMTISRWIADGRLDPTDIFDIIEKFNRPSLLDRRRKDKSNVES